MARILQGADVVSAINERVMAGVGKLASIGVTPTLAIVRIGERPDDISYEKTAIKRCDTIGAAVKGIVLPADVTLGELIGTIHALNDDKDVHGVLMLRPLPKRLDEEAVCAALSPDKDVDGVTEGSLSGVYSGNGKGFSPCTAQACMEILDFYGIDCTGKRAVVIGRSLVVGKPVAMMLLDRNATVTVCHTRTADIPAVARTAEILIVSAGKIGFITGEFLSPGQVVIDVGINWNSETNKLCGDVRFEEAEPIVGAITPVPGGVGTVTTSVLVSHVVEAAMKRYT